MTPKGTTRPRHFDEPRTEAFDDHPLANMAETLRDDHPLSLLTTGSMMAWVLEPKSVDLGPGDEPRSPHEFIETLIVHDDPATTALLGALRLFLDDEVARRRCDREVRRRRWATPPWFDVLADVEVTNVVESRDELGDGDNVYLELRWPTGHEATVVAYIDHHVGAAVKDAFAVPMTVAEMRSRMRNHIESQAITFVDVDPADARARLEDAVESSNRTWPPLESDTWPGAQPLVRWALRQLPEGGQAPEWREWSPTELEDIASAFLSSPFAEGLEPEDAELVDHLLWYGTAYGSGDPYRWGPPRVEILLLDWVPRKIIAPFEDLMRMPAVAKAFVRWAHDVAGIPLDSTMPVLEVIDDCTPDYLAAIGDDERLQGPAAILAAMGLERDFEGDPFSYEGLVREQGIRSVGSEDAYDRLDVDPLPDEPLDLARLPEDVRDRVGRIGALTDRVCDDVFQDVELRTACRRLLVDVAAADPAIFRRRSKDEPVAGAICWVIAKVNRVLEHGDTGPMLATIGVTGSVSQRAQPMLSAIGVHDFSSWGSELGSPRYLTSRRRAGLIRRREEYRGR